MGSAMAFSVQYPLTLSAPGAMLTFFTLLSKGARMYDLASVGCLSIPQSYSPAWGQEGSAWPLSK
jgi:hypothetical protein